MVSITLDTQQSKHQQGTDKPDTFCCKSQNGELQVIVLHFVLNRIFHMIKLQFIRQSMILPNEVKQEGLSC